MLDVRYSTKFKKDFRICVRRRYKYGNLQQAIDILRIPDTLPPKNADHNFSGNYTGYRECYVSPDWLLIYRQDGNELLLYRTGTHIDLFRTQQKSLQSRFWRLQCHTARPAHGKGMGMTLLRLSVRQNKGRWTPEE